MSFTGSGPRPTRQKARHLQQHHPGSGPGSSTIQSGRDELNPRRGHESLHIGNTSSIGAPLKSLRVLFSTELASLDESTDIALCRLPCPESVIYQLHRCHHRVAWTKQTTCDLAVRSIPWFQKQDIYW